MDAEKGFFEVERVGDVLVLTPLRDLRELDYPEIEVEGKELLWLESDAWVRGVVVDFGRTDYFGSTAIGLLLRLGRRMRNREGRLALCNVSDHEKEILAAAGLAGFWTAYPSREGAVKAAAGVAAA